MTEAAISLETTTKTFGAVRSGVYNPNIRHGNTIAIDSQVLGWPSMVLNEKAQWSEEPLTYMYTRRDRVTKELTKHKVIATRSLKEVPFPTATHYRTLMTLISMFAYNHYPDGGLYFTFSDVLRNMGVKEPKRGYTWSSIKMVKETIERYSCLFFQTIDVKTGLVTKEMGSYLATQNIYSSQKLLSEQLDFKNLSVSQKIEIRKKMLKLDSNPRNTKEIDKLHRITFHERIVNHIANKGVRLFQPQILQGNMPDTALALYTYAYSFWSRISGTSIELTYDRLIPRMQYKSPFRRFPKWVTGQLEKIQGAGEYINSFEVQPYDPRAKVIIYPIKQVMTQAEKAHEELKKKARKYLDELKSGPAACVPAYKKVLDSYEERFEKGDFSFIDQSQS